MTLNGRQNRALLKRIADALFPCVAEPGVITQRTFVDAVVMVTVVEAVSHSVTWQSVRLKWLLGDTSSQSSWKKFAKLVRSVLTYLTYALSVTPSRTYSPQTTCLNPAVSYAATSIFLQLYLYPAVHISFSRSLLQVFLGRPLPLSPCGVHWSTCLVMLSSFLLNVCLSQFHFFLCIWSSTGSGPVFPYYTGLENGFEKT